MSSGRPSSAFRGHSGSAHKGRPRPTKSPLPEAMISSARSGVVMEPEAMTGTETSFLMASAAQTLWHRGMAMGDT